MRALTPGSAEAEQKLCTQAGSFTFLAVQQVRVSGSAGGRARVLVIYC